ncbi:NAD(P)-dependent alcohol dehydrogenase [Legionella fallonii]|uniref:Putative oxidoreductase, Zn-dependent and NAD(P)-binding n=1 Tax=Legionella fallonii LLAP-10 TaxID=1212491 RepID=A0A098G0P6_9GAMM|nr:NAD(P)-dependent alcohol dehydrogenase [Legionella fallonii]CEG56087.1 putative oxidoreductase, Zn-dependent and NAD(P)-binding [Legionella fallonii LLAP-10]
MIKAKGYAAQSAQSSLEPFSFERRSLGPQDVHIDILYCGICHSDLHTARNEWGNSVYPVVPGHEIVGKVVEVGDQVKKFKKGDTVGVGCLVDSCRTCSSCQEGLEQFCETGFTLTYNSQEKETGGMTYGGYSDKIIVNQDFILRVPESLDLKAVAPLLCAGITTYSPLRHWQVKKGDKVGVVGLGGLGHMAVKIAHALGAQVTMITTSPDKEKDARRLGASEILLSTNPDMMARFANHFDLIINTIPRTHDINPYLNLLKRDATMVIVGAVEVLQTGLDTRFLIFKRKSVAGSLIGGIKETQEMLDFCAEHNVLPDVEMISMQNINEAYERLLKNDVKYRFVIDMASLKG